MGDGPYLILAAFWVDEDDTEAVAEALRAAAFSTPDGYPRGAVVSFSREIAESPRFQHDLERFELRELNPSADG